MADLQVCYFCGSGPDSSLGEYAVVPPDLDPTDDQQRSVALCPECRGKLTTVMEPVVEAAGARANSGDDAGDDSGSALGDPTAGDDPRQAGVADDPVSDAAASGDGNGAGSGDGSAGSDPPSGAGDEVDVPPTGTGGDAEGGVSIDRDREVASGDAGSGGPSDPTDGDDSSADDGDGVDPGAARRPPHADDELVGRNNEAYNKTLRLLQNREFPVERHEIEQVAANAYQLDPQEVSDAIDSLIQKGLLSQEGAHLLRPA